MKNRFKGPVFLLVIFVLGVVSQGVTAQQKRKTKVEIIITGTVVNSSNTPIANAAVYANQRESSSITNADGVFTLNAQIGSSITIECKGYETRTIDAQSENGAIVLSESDNMFGEESLVSLAFRSDKRGRLVGNVSKVDVVNVLRNDNVDRIQSILDTYVPGQRDGLNLLGIGNAVIFVDGLVRDISNLVPEEVESITVLKDVNSLVLYGSQAKNGVILIKTKRGIANKNIMQFGIETGFNVPIQLPKYLKSIDYLSLYSEAQKNDNPSKAPNFSPEEIAKYDGRNPFRYPDVDYYGEDYLKPMYNTTRFSGEFGGGNKVATYYTNIGWEHNGVLYNSEKYNYGSDRLRVRGNVDYKINEYLTSYLNAAFIFDINSSPRTDFYSMASTFRPNDYAVLLPSTAFEVPSMIDPLRLINGNSVFGGTGLTSKNTYGKNVFGELNYAGTLRNYMCTMQMDAGVTYDLKQFINGLKLNANIAFDSFVTYAEQIQNTYALYEPIWNDENDKITGLNVINKDSSTGILTLSSGALSRSLMANVSAEYNKSFDNGHHLETFLLGYYSMQTVGGSLHSLRNAHLGLRVGYDYQQRYMVDLSGALINSVKLAPGHRASFSPSLGLGWMISKEDFWNSTNVVNILKLKASAGVLQTDASPYFGYNMYRGIYTGGNGFGTGDSGGYNYGSLYVNHTANPSLGMEKMKNLNIGFEMIMFDQTLCVNASFFKTRYSDQVVQRFASYPTMFSSFIPYENYNESDYTGVDASLMYQNNYKEVYFSAGLNLLYSRSKWIKVDEVYNNSYQYQQGTATDAIRGLQFTGFFPTDESAIAANQQFDIIRRGDMAYADLDNNNTINTNDMTVIGNYDPRFKAVLNAAVQYENFSLTVVVGSRLGYNWVMSSTESPNNYFWVDGDTKYSEMVLGRWTDDSPLTATYPRLSAKSSDNNFRNSNFWIRNGNDFSLERIQLNYSFPQKWIRRSFVKTASVYARGTNLLFFAEDAQLRQTNINILTRSFSLGLKMSF